MVQRGNRDSTVFSDKGLIVLYSDNASKRIVYIRTLLPPGRPITYSVGPKIVCAPTYGYPAGATGPTLGALVPWTDFPAPCSTETGPPMVDITEIHEVDAIVDSWIRVDYQQVS